MESFQINDRKVSVYPGLEGSPIVYLNSFMDNSDSIHRLLKSCPDHTLVVISHLHWDDDMTPWYCPPLSKDDAPCGGKADAWLETMIEKIIPRVEDQLEEKPAYRILTGYSLAGLFAVYALYQTDMFQRVGSMSGSLWFPDFVEYIQDHKMVKQPDYLYFSLGNKEARTRHPLLKTVQKNTETIVKHYQEEGIDTFFELNPGNHYQDAEQRTIKGITWLLTREDRS
jgi:predicted alpha/beta superfamily hydrolase